MTEPEVSVPAVMRNYHEVLRNDLARVLTPLAEAGDVAAFANAWRSYTRAIAVHAAMEDGVEGVDGAGGGSAAMLDHYFDGAAGAAMFKAEHLDEHAMQAAVTAALADGAFYGDPPDATHPWAIHDMNRPQPTRVEPGTFSSQEKPGTPPSRPATHASWRCCGG